LDGNKFGFESLSLALGYALSSPISKVGRHDPSNQQTERDYTEKAGGYDECLPC
jgi:hypothetical protein